MVVQGAVVVLQPHRRQVEPARQPPLLLVSLRLAHGVEVELLQRLAVRRRRLLQLLRAKVAVAALAVRRGGGDALGGLVRRAHVAPPLRPDPLAQGRRLQV